MQTDQVKLYAATLTAVVMAIGGTLLLVFIWMQPGIEDKAGLSALLGGSIGYSLNFLFGQETATRAVRSYQSGLNTPVPDPTAGGQTS